MHVLHCVWSGICFEVAPYHSGPPSMLFYQSFPSQLSSTPPTTNNKRQKKSFVIPSRGTPKTKQRLSDLANQNPVKELPFHRKPPTAVMRDCGTFTGALHWRFERGGLHMYMFVIAWVVLCGGLRANSTSSLPQSVRGDLPVVLPEKRTGRVGLCVAVVGCCI